MKAAKLRKTNLNVNKKTIEKEEYSIKKLLLIILIIISIFIAFYVITTFIVKPAIINNNNQKSTSLDLTKISFSSLLSKKDNEYYVIVTKESLYTHNGYSKTNYSDIYNKYITDYTKKDKSLNFYVIDLDDVLNKSYYSDKLNITNDLKELTLNNEALFKISNNKIDKYYIGSSEIIKALSNL